MRHGCDMSQVIRPARDDDVLPSSRRQCSFAKVALVRQMARSVGMMIIFGWWAREMSHVGLIKCLRRVRVETDALKRNKDFGFYPNRSLPRSGRGGRRFKILPLRPMLSLRSSFMTRSWSGPLTARKLYKSMKECPGSGRFNAQVARNVSDPASAATCPPARLWTGFE
jgi:hypothetical protein